MSLTRPKSSQIDSVMPSVSDFGAVGDGTTDDTVALQAALDSNQVCFVPKGKYRTTANLVIDPIRNRNGGFVGVPPTRYPYTQQTSGPAWNGLQESIIFYDGATSATAAVIAASAEPVGTEPAAAFSTTVYGCTLRDVTLDANGKAGFGLYTARVQDIQLYHLEATGATVAGITINGTYSGSVQSCRTYLNPGRGFELGAADDRWSWTAQDSNNALNIRDLHANANGGDATFRESDPVLRESGCGVYFGPHRAVTIFGVTSENNFGANIVFKPTSSGNTVHGVYTELGCKYAPSGVGSDAITLGYATRQLGLIFIGATDAVHNRVSDGIMGVDNVWLTGTEPSVGRPEGGFELQNISLCAGMQAEWGNYRLVNCAQEMETNLTGTLPSGAFTVRGGLSFGRGVTEDPITGFEMDLFVPTLEGTTVAGTGWAFSVAAAEMRRINDQVTVSGRIVISALSLDATGQIMIGGFQYPVKNANNYHSPANIGAANLATPVVSISGAAKLGYHGIVLRKREAAATSFESLFLADLAVGTIIDFACTYIADLS